MAVSRLQLPVGRPQGLRRFGIAALAVAGITGIRLLLEPILTNHLAFTTFFIAVYLSSLFGGLGPGLFATALSAVAGAYFIAGHQFSFVIGNLGDIVQLVLFVIVATAISVSNDRMRVAHSRLRGAAAELQHRNLVMNMALTAGMSGSWELDLATGRLLWDEASERLYGLALELLPTSQAFFALIHPDDVDRVRADVDDCRNERISSFRHEFRLMLPQGVRYMEGRGQVDYDATGKAVRLIGITTDITDRKRAEEERARLETQLREARHLESVGRLAGGVAHDFNNLLTVINGYAESLIDQLNSQDALSASATRIRKAGRRAAELVGQLLAFSQRQMIRPRTLDLNEIIVESQAELRQVLGTEREVVLALEPHLGHAVADPERIHQIMVDLAVNALEAMPNGGRVEIKTGNFDLGAEEAPVDAEPGPYVRMTVTDTGMGMTQEDLQHIFEPFFNAKKLRGVGAGIGLAAVYGIVRQSKGWIDVRSELGKGTSFRIHLPRADGAVTDESEHHVRTEH
jgi:PAS domain S-box-containing protein